jgi:hypothetical protein
LGVRDVLRERVAETLEDWTGLTLRPVDHVQALEESSSRWGAFADEAEDLAANVMDYVDGRPREVSHESRRTLSRRSRAAFIRDPLAGAEANLRANFSFGRGIPIPQAADEKVQKIIDAAWKDPNNERKLTSFEAQRHRSNDLLTTANLYAVGYEANGRFRVGFHDPDLVTEIVCHPEDEETPLWYVVRKKRTDWDFDQHHQEYRYLELKDGIERVYYVEHWRNVKDAEEQAAEFGMERPKRPNAEDVIPGRMEHFRINRVGRTQFGIPPWARTLRFYSAMNQITEAQVAMRQAAATIIAKRVRSGGPRDIMKAAANVMTGAGELASSRFSGNIRGAGPGTDPSAGAPPPPAGSHWIENESDRPPPPASAPTTSGTRPPLTSPERPPSSCPPSWRRGPGRRPSRGLCAGSLTWRSRARSAPVPSAASSPRGRATAARSSRSTSVRTGRSWRSGPGSTSPTTSTCPTPAAGTSRTW